MKMVHIFLESPASMDNTIPKFTRRTVLVAADYSEVKIDEERLDRNVLLSSPIHDANRQLLGARRVWSMYIFSSGTEARLKDNFRKGPASTQQHNTMEP